MVDLKCPYCLGPAWLGTAALYHAFGDHRLVALCNSSPGVQSDDEDDK